MNRATLEDRCSRCTCAEDALSPQRAVIEAARQFMAANLRAEWLGAKPGMTDREYNAYEAAARAAIDAMQDLRDCLAAERRNRSTNP